MVVEFAFYGFISSARRIHADCNVGIFVAMTQLNLRSKVILYGSPQDRKVFTISS